MFTSKQHLQFNLGVDTRIAEFFVDRKVPANNAYWKGRLLYVAAGTGYRFIPLFFDLQYKCGISREDLLDEEYVTLMEAILNSAAMHEWEEIGYQEHIRNCKKIMTGNIKNKDLYDDLAVYFDDEDLRPYKNLGTASKALNRGDTYLFSLCFLTLDKKLCDKVIESWYALVPSFLLMDDIIDLGEDQEKNEENAVNDFGKGSEGVSKSIEFLRKNFNQLKNLNQELGMFFEKSLDRKLQTTYMQSLLNT